ncbi:hypothetical protein [uncultured Algibacter sp.]|uniref:hypothetical protein n=1 Tax=uncultured Algibacter sp. TaxID=298659 RepID=UPI003216ABEE
MKNVIKNTKKGILMVAMFTTILSFANEGSFFSIKNEATKTSMTLKKVKRGNNIYIKDNNGIIIFNEQIEANGVYRKGFDLTSLPNGQYTFEVDKYLEINTIPFVVSQNKVVFDKEKEKVTYKPFIRVEDNVVYVTKLSLDKKPLNINIYYKDDIYNEDIELIHSEKIEDTKTIERIYKLDGLERGTYKIVIDSEDRQFVKVVD